MSSLVCIRKRVGEKSQRCDSAARGTGSVNITDRFALLLENHSLCYRSVMNNISRFRCPSSAGEEVWLRDGRRANGVTLVASLRSANRIAKNNIHAFRPKLKAKAENTRQYSSSYFKAREVCCRRSIAHGSKCDINQSPDLMQIECSTQDAKKAA